MRRGANIADSRKTINAPGPTVTPIACSTGTLNSTLIATLTTAIGFGTLALSNVPVLHAVGATVGPGAVLALLLAAVFVGRQARAGVSRGTGA